jgi:hypothetical protein
MSSTLHNGSGRRQSTPVDHETTVLTTAVDKQELAELRRALSDCGETMESIALQADIKDRSLVHRILSGERPMPSGFLDSLPHAAVGLWHARRAEAHGRRVFDPLDTETAVQHFAAGLLSLVMHGALGALLPTKARQMAKVEANGNGQRKAAV